MKTVTTIGFLIAAGYGLNAQQHTETFKKELQFEQSNAKNSLQIANINGHIEVEGYDGSTISVEAKRSIYTRSEKLLEETKRAINMKVIDLGDSLIVYTTHPCNDFTYNRQGEWGYGYNWSGSKRNCEWEVKYQVDYLVRIPRNVNVKVSTVNNGDIEIANLDAEVEACNVNGAISLEGVQNVTKATTINGDVTIKFSSNPVKNASYYTLNGDIRALCKKGLSADMSFKSYNGDFYTNISPIENLPLKLEIEKHNKSAGINYKLDSKAMMRARNGGIYLDFETFNGDVFVEEF